MSAKKEEAPPAAKDAAPAADAGAKPAGKGMNPIIPLAAVIVLAPVLSIVAMKFFMLPALTKQLAAAPAEGGAAEEHGGAEAEGGEHGKEAKGEKGEHGKEGKGKKGEAAGAGNTYEFENIVVNLAGTMGTRYLKTTFIVTGKDKGLRGAIESNKPKMVDVTINVLSSLSLADLEEAGAKNIIREKLLAAYNQALDRRMADQIYFTDFVVQ